MNKFKIIIPFLFLFASLVNFTSCSDIESVEEITEEEAVAILEATFQPESGGPVTSSKEVSKNLNSSMQINLACNTLQSDEISREYQGNRLQASYQLGWSYELACNSFNIPETASFSSTSTNSFSTSKVSGASDSEMSGSVTGLQLSSRNMSMVAEYTQSGTQQLLTMSKQDTYSNTLELSLTELNIDKVTAQIESGSGSFRLIINSTTQSYEYEGTIIFNGGKTATIIINGMEYSIDWD